MSWPSSVMQAIAAHSLRTSSPVAATPSGFGVGEDGSRIKLCCQWIATGPSLRSITRVEFGEADKRRVLAFGFCLTSHACLGGSSRSDP